MSKFLSSMYTNRAKIAAAAAASSSLLAVKSCDARRQGNGTNEDRAAGERVLHNTVPGRDAEHAGLRSRRRADRKETTPFLSATASVLYPPRMIMNPPLLADYCRCEGAVIMAPPPLQRPASIIKRQKTITRMNAAATRKPLRTRYKINPDPLGEGAFGAVYSAVDRSTGDAVAVKKVSKRLTSDSNFQREVNALLRIQAFGGHPNICSLRETFNENDGHYYLVLDLVSGGEMFDHLIQNGAYSEADAARLVREAASALAHLHGIGVVHADLKPENLMLSTSRTNDAVVKLVDFGSAKVDEIENYGGVVDDRVFDLQNQVSTDDVSLTPAYCPPEAFEQAATADSGRDMWALGTILYIMLTGCHPFDLTGEATDEQIEESIRSKRPPPLDDSPITAHLSRSSLDVIKKLLEPDSRKRVSAHQLLSHPWVQGETARKDVMADSDKKLSNFRAFKSQLAMKVFQDIVFWSDDDEMKRASKKMSLIERAFQQFDKHKKGYLTTEDVQGQIGETVTPGGTNCQKQGGTQSSLDLSGFHDLLADNMKNKYFPMGHVVYREGDLGDHMYFINAGTIEVSTKDGFKVTLGNGDFFGEGALLNPNKTRCATIRCVTPVHAIEISREYVEKYLSSADSALLKVNMREKDKRRARDRAKNIIRLQGKLNEKHVRKGENLFQEGEVGDALYIVEEGEVVVSVKGKNVLSLKQGELCGDHALITGRPRNSSATCISEECRVHEMKKKDFFDLLDCCPDLKKSIRETCLRRDFQKALCVKLDKSFPSASDLKEAFGAADEDSSGSISLDEVRNILRLLDPLVPEDEILEVVNSLDLDETGDVNFQEFKRIFGVS